MEKENRYFVYTVLPIAVLFMALLLVSCVTLKPASAKTETQHLSRENLSQLNGSYRIMSTDSSSLMLDYCLLLKRKFNLVDKPSPDDRVAIEAIGNDKLMARVFRGERVIAKKKIKGIFKDGCFEFCASRIRPFLLVNFYNRQKTRITKMKNGDLSIDDAGKGFIFLVFLPATGATSGGYNLIFRKIN